jgi:hypothetical protein
MNLRIDCYLIIMWCLETKGRTRRHIEEGLEVWRTSKGVRVKMEVQTKSISSLFWSPGAVCIKLDTRVAYELHLWWSIYGWKDNFLRKPMEVVPLQNSIRINRNHQNKLMSEIYHNAASSSFGALGLVTCWDTFRTWRGVLGCLLGYIISSHRLH